MNSRSYRFTDRLSFTVTEGENHTFPEQVKMDNGLFHHVNSRYYE